MFIFAVVINWNLIKRDFKQAIRTSPYISQQSEVNNIPRRHALLQSNSCGCVGLFGLP